MKAYKIAIIGVGPKGLYAFERLIAHLDSHYSELTLEVHLFEKSGNFGAGQIYEPSQPEYLLMNYPNRKIDVWATEMPKNPIAGIVSFSEWLSEWKGLTVEKAKYMFAPRAWVGTYLSECFETIYEFGSDRCRIFKHRTVVNDIEIQSGSHRLIFESENGNMGFLDVHDILLTTGHCSWKGNLLKSNHDKNIPYVYPVAEKLASIEDGTNVVIKGLGLTFIDTVLALTEGRGGTFEKNGHGTLLYLPSGHEPNKIFAYSRSGLPMIPRSAQEGSELYEPIYFTHEAIHNQMGIGEKPSFEKHILPLYKLETKYRYYKVLFENFNLTLHPEGNREGLERQIAIFRDTYPEEAQFNFANLFKPVSFAHPETDLGSLAYLRYLIVQAELGSRKSPYMAAAMTWGKLASVFNSIYSFGGMTSDSHRLFDQEYRSMLNRISYGPPLQNMHKVVALIETGILDLDYAKNPQVQSVASGFDLSVDARKSTKINTVIDARIPANKTSDDWSVLLSNLHQREMIREFLVAGKSSYKTACPEINRLGNVINKNGRANTNITTYGTLTEGITYDNDSLSRSRNNMASAWALRTIERGTQLQSQQ